MLDSAIHLKNHFPADKTFGDQYFFLIPIVAMLA